MAASQPRTDFVSIAVWTDGPEDDLGHRGDGHHFVVVSQGAAHHSGVERHSVDHPVEARRGEDLLPARRLLHPGGDTGPADVPHEDQNL